MFSFDQKSGVEAARLKPTDVVQGLAHGTRTMWLQEPFLPIFITDHLSFSFLSFVEDAGTQKTSIS